MSTSETKMPNETVNAIESMFKQWMEVPAQSAKLMIETSKKAQEISIDYLQQMERVQRDYLQSAAQMWSTTLPGESRIWDAQSKMMENGFEMLDRMMAASKKA